jgi:K+/H+ antiporter YhaU regulatory subunit KhtT
MTNRDVKRNLIETETAWAIKQPQEYFKRVADFDAAWTDMIMYDEHTWGAHNSISEPDSDFVKQQDDYKQEFAKRASRNIDKLREEVNINLSVPQYQPEGVYANTQEGTIGNDLISLKVDKKTGAIVSFKMKGIPHDLVNPGDDGNSGWNDYLYIIGRDATKNRERYDQGVKVTTRAVNGVASINVDSPAPNCQFLQRKIVVTSDSPVVFIRNTMRKKMERQPEGTFFGFPFNIPNGVWRIDTPWAMVQVEKDQLPGANRNYYCVQNFCNLSNDEYGIDFATYSAPIIQFSPILFTPAWDKTLKTWREHI